MPGRVLIIDDLATNRIILKVKLSAAYYDVVQATGLTEAIARMETLKPDLILLGRSHAAEADIAAQIMQLESVHASAQAVPVIVLLDNDDSALRVAALAAGAAEVMARPLDEKLLLARLRSLMRQRLSDLDLHHHTLAEHALGFAEKQSGFEASGRIGVISHDKAEGRKLQSRLAAHGRYSLTMMSAQDLMGARPAAATRKPPDVFVLQLGEAASETGPRLLSELRADPDTRTSPIIVHLPEQDSALAAQLFDLGAGDVVSSVTNPQEIGVRVERQLKEKRRLENLRNRLQDGLQAAVIDPLTGLHNRRYALSYLECLISETPAGAESYAVMVADLDYFKQINDRFGHTAGDAVLRRVAQRIKTYLRKDDLVARIGGEEFLIIIPGTSQDEARQIATGLCDCVAQSDITLPGQTAKMADQTTKVNVTISIGLTLGKAGHSNAEQIIDEADRALYRSKEAGRNTVRFSARSAA